MTVMLAHNAFGDGPALVILHGLFGAGRNWASLARRLGESWQVLTPDLRNHGASPWADEMTYPAMAADLLGFLDQQGVERARFVGHSMGGKVAMTMALTHPDRVAALMVVDIAPVAYRHDFSDYISAMLAVDLSRFSRRGEVDAVLREQVPDPGVRAFILQNLAQGEGGLAWRLNLQVLATNMPRISGFPEELTGHSYAGGGVLFLGGDRSDYIREDDHAQILRLFPGAEIETLADAGHWVHAEQPDRFQARLVSFLRSAESG